MRKTVGLAIVLIFSLCILNAEEPRYTNNSFARLSYITGNTYIQRASDLSYEEGVVNMPITEGDRLGTTEGRAEIYLGRSNYVRLDYRTKIDFFKLPDRGSDLVQIQIWSGSVYFSIRNLDREKGIEIHSPDVSLYLLDRGIYRLDVRENGETEILVFEGLLEAAGETGSVLVKEEQRLEADGGHFINRPTRFYRVAGDSFDRWSAYRDSQIRKRLARRYLPGELEDFEYELAYHGDWVYIPPYGHVWVPGGVDPYWRPYYHGRWVWLPLCGWTWHPYEPWGWVTFHYGRWHWSIGIGWYWIPRTVWGPAWVNWYWGYDYVCWAPLGYYNRPVVVINNVFYDRYPDPYYPRNSTALTVIHKNQLRAKNVSKVALSQPQVKKLGKIQLSKRTLSLKPSASKITVDNIGDKKVFLRKAESQIRFKQSKRPSPTLEGKSKASTAIKKGESSLRIGSSGEKKITKKKIGYQSTRDNKKGKSSEVKKSDSVVGRIYKYITGDSKSKSTKSSKGRSVSKSPSREKSSSRGKTSKSRFSRSSSKRSSSKAMKKPSSRKPSSRSKATKVKKKKKG